MSLAQAVANYIGAYEGHTNAEGYALVELRRKLSQSTLDEIIFQNNALTMQRLWNPVLMDLFFDELLSRLQEETTFALTTSWYTLEDWLGNPYVVAWVGFEDKYPITDPSEPILDLNVDQVKNFTFTNLSFTPAINKLIIEMLMEDSVEAIIYVYPNGKLEIGQIVNAKRPEESIVLIDAPQGQFQPVPVQVELRRSIDWHRLNQLYQGLRVQIPVIEDPYNEELINQLIDLKEAQDIVDDEGFTFEGDLLLSAARTEEE